jgi:hypothetical protein
MRRAKKRHDWYCHFSYPGMSRSERGKKSAKDLAKWVDPRIRMPKTYDLVTIQYSDFTEQAAWWTGVGWEAGRGIKKHKNIIRWKWRRNDHCLAHDK